MTNLFLDHPRRAGETYGEHLRFASSIGLTMVAGGLACFFHGLAPFLCETTGSRLLRRAQRKIDERRTPDGVA